MIYHKLPFSLITPHIERKKVNMTLLWLISSVLYTTKSFASDNLHLYGTIGYAACTVSPESLYIDVKMPPVEGGGFDSNSRTTGTKFQVKLENCNIEISKSVYITFRGKESTELPGLIDVDIQSTAKGISIGLETIGGVAIPFNKKSLPFVLVTGGSSISLKSYIKKIPNVKLNYGLYTATATFELEYQ